MSIWMTKRGIVPPPNRVLVVVNGVPVRGGSIELMRDAENYDRGARSVAFPWFGSNPELRVIDGAGKEVYRAREAATDYRISMRRSGREVHCVSAKG